MKLILILRVFFPLYMADCLKENIIYCYIFEDVTTYPFKGIALGLGGCFSETTLYIWVLIKYLMVIFKDI